MVKFYNWVGLSLLFILSCGNPINITGPKYSDVIVTEARFDDQLIVKGSRFKDIRAVALRDPNTGQIIKRFKVMRYDDHTIIGEQTDYNKIPIPNILDMLIDSAQGQSVIPVQFTISPNSVYTGAIQNGSITPTKFKGVSANPPPPTQVVLNYDPITENFFFAPPLGSGGAGGVNQIAFGEGIYGEGGVSTNTQVDISVNVGESGSSTVTYIPYFSDLNELTIDSTTNSNTRVLFLDNASKVSLNFDAGLFKIHNDSVTLPSTAGDLLTVDLFGKVTAAGSLFVGTEPVCLADGTGCPSGIQPITGDPPIIVTGTNISADMGTNPGQLVQLEPVVGSGTVGSLPPVDGIKLLNIVTKINALDGITVTNGGVGIVDIGLAPAGSTGSAQPWSPALDDISTLTYPPVDGGVIVGNGTNYNLESGDIFRAHVGLAIGVDVQAFNQNLEQISNATPTAPGQFLLSSNPGQWSLANNPNCGPSGHLMAGDGTNFNCSDNSFTFKLKELQFYETVAAGGSYVGFAAPVNVLTTTIWALPPQDGPPGSVLTTNGLKILSWGTGNGDVRGPNSATDEALARFDTTTGKLIQNSNVTLDDFGNLTGVGNINGTSVANFVTGPVSSVNGNLASFDLATGKVIKDSLIPSANVVTMIAPGTGNYVLGSALGFKTATEGNVLVGDIPSMSVAAAASNTVILSAGAKNLKSSAYTVPPIVCPIGEILKSDGTNYICGPDTDTAPPVISVFGRNGTVTAQFGDYNSNLVESFPTGAVGANTVQGAITELDGEKLALIGGDMTGTIRSTANIALQVGPYGAAAGNTGEIHYLELALQGAQYVGFKAPDTINSNVIWTLPATAGASGTVLTNNTGNILSWNSPSSLGIGDVVGPASSSDSAIARFNSTTGKIIKNSTVILDDTGNLTGVTSINGAASSNFVTMTATPTSFDYVYLSNGADKTAKTTNYTMPALKCTDGQILKFTAGNLACTNDTSGVVSFNSRTGVVVSVAGDYNAAQVNSTPTGFLSANNVQNALNELDLEKIPAAGGTMTGTLFTTTQYAIGIGAPGPNPGEVRFFEASNGPNYAGFKSPAVLNANYILTLPPDIGSPTQILSTSGGGVLSWTTPGGGGAGGVGDVVGPSSSTATNLASFSNGTGKLIQDSGISSNNVVTMTGPALAPGNILISQGLNKVAIDSFVNISPAPGNNVTNLGTLNGRDIANWVDGPAGAISTNLAAFNGVTGKAILDSGLSTANIPTMGLNATNPNQMILSGGVSKQLVAATYTVPANSGATGQILTVTAPNVATWANPVGIGDVVGASSSTLNALVRYNSTSGKSIYTSPATLDDFGGLTGITSINGKTAGDFVTMANPATNTGQVFLSAGAKAAVAAPYTFPVTQGLTGQVLKLNSPTDATWQTIGGGDVSGPGPTTALNEVAVWVDNTGTKIKGVPLIYLNIVTNVASSTVPNHVAVFDSATGKSIADSGKLITDLVTGPAGANPGNLASYNGAGGKLIQDSGISTTNVVTMIATPTGANYVYLSNGADKTAKTSDFTIPSSVCPSGQVLKSNGTIYTCSLVGSGDVVGPATSVAGRPATYLDATGRALANTVPYTIPTITGSSGQVLTSDGFGSTSWATITQGDVVGPGGSADNQAALFSGTTGKIIKAAPYTLPIINGTNGQALTTNGAGVASWSAVGNVTQTTSSVAGNIPAYVDTTGKSLVDSNVLATNIVTMPTPALITGQVMLSAAAGKAAMVAPYTFPLTIVGTNGQVLTSNGVDAVWKSGGTGDVSGPGAVTALNELAVWADATGLKIKNVPLVYLNIVTNVASSTTPNHVAVFDSATGKSIADSGKLITDLVTGPAGANPGNVASYNGAGGKLIQDSGISTTNVVTMIASPTAANYVYLSNGADKIAKTSSYTFPPTVCTLGQVLKSDGANYTCSAVGSGDVIGPATSVAGRPATYLDASGKALANTVPYTIPTLTGIPGQVLTTDGVGATSWTTITPGTGDVVGPGGSADNQAALFSGTTGKIIKTAPYTLPTANGTSGQALTTNGAGAASWSNVGNVAGAPSSIAGNIPSFSDASGKALQDSNIPSANIVQMPNAATFIGQLLMSNGPGKQAQPSPYKFPTDTLGTNGQVLTSNGVDVIWASAAGNVVGPATSALNELAVFADGTGKLIKAVPLVYLNIVTNTATPTVPNHVAVFDSATGKSIIDSGKLITNLVTGPAGALVGNLASYSVADGKTIQDSLIPTANVVQNNGTATANAIARFDLATGKLIKNSPVVIDDSGNLTGVGTINGNTAANIVTMNATPTAANYVYLSNGNDKTAKTTTYTFPPGPCLAGQILKTDASFNFQCVADTSGVASFNSRIGAVMPAGNDYTASIVASTAFGAIAATTTQGAINELETEKLSLSGGTMTGQLITSTQNAILIGKAAGPISGELKFEEATGNQYVGFKSPDTLAGNVIWTLPIADGASGTVLSTNGAAQLFWSSPSAAGFGNVNGPASSTDNAIARFDLATGKLIQNSVVTISDGGDLSGVASFTSTGNFSVSGAGSFTGGLSAQSYTNTSDKSLKKDIEPFTGAASIIDKLMPVSFRWKTGDEKKVIGLIAQDMEKVIPEVVSKSNQKGNIVRSYDLGQVLILTLEALKETREELKQTKTELKVMREKVQDLEKRIP